MPNCCFAVVKVLLKKVTTTTTTTTALYTAFRWFRSGLEPRDLGVQSVDADWTVVACCLVEFIRGRRSIEYDGICHSDV